MRDPGRNTWTFDTGASDVAEALPPAPFDALTDPSVEELLPAGLSLWPRGAAWGTPDGQAASTESGIANLTRALLAPFTDLYRRAHGLTQESRALTLIDSLDDWEADFGLPDECAAPGAGAAARRRALLSRVRSLATVTPADFVVLARQEGFEIAIEEPSTFECGFSECGGAHAVGGVLQQVYWIVHVYALAVDYFTCGESECGADRLFEVEGAERLQCLFRRLYPGWTQPVYVFHDVRGADDMLPVLEPGLAIDFTDQSFAFHPTDDPDLSRSGALADLTGLTFTRASSAMRINASGEYESVANNVRRLDHDPVTLAPRGYLSEPAATNLCRNNTMVGAVAGNPGTWPSSGWSVGGVASGLTLQITGLGTEAGIAYVEFRISGVPASSGASPVIFFCNGTSVSGGQKLTCSAFVSLVAGSMANLTGGLSARSYSGGTTTQGYGNFVPTPGSLTQRRYSLTHTVGAGNTVYDAIFYMNVTAGQPVDATFRLGLPQVEVGDVPTSPIQTSGSAATRAADLMSLNPVTYPFNWTAGAVVLEAVRPAAISLTTELFFISGSPARGVILSHLSSDRLQLYHSDSVSAADVITANTVTGGSVFRVVFAWDASRFYLCLAGGAVLSLNRLAFTNFGSINFANGYRGFLRKTSFLTRTPTAAEMQALTS